MAAIGIQPGSISPTTVYPEISTPSKPLAPSSGTQTPSQQQTALVPRSSEDSKKKEMEEFLRAAEKHIEGHDPGTSELSVGVDKATHQIVVKILDSKTKEVIRQIPPEEILRLARNMKKMKVGFLDEMA